MRISLCLLTRNEVEGCRHDVPRLPVGAFEEVYAIDGGSTDGTCEYLSGQGIAVHQQDTPGYNNAYLSAFRRCTTEAVVLFHPKGSVDPEVVTQFRPFLEAGYDLVVASRMAPGARNEEDAHLLRPRKWFVLGLGLVARVLWRREGDTVWDVLHGLRAVRVDRLPRIKPLDRGLSIDLELVVRAYKHRLRRTEFPVVERARLHGTTHFRAWPTGLAMLRYLAAELTRAD
jgi:hypothetical protein